MPAITVGYPEFEARLLKVKGVINRSSLTDAVCTVGATMMLAGAATTLSRLVFAGAPLAWIQLAVYAAAATKAVAVAWRLRTNWLDLHGTALHVDQQAGMHARLATMLAHPSPDTGSQLRTILLWEIFDLSPQWDLQRIAPRRIRRPAVALAIAVFTFALARFLQPTPGQQPATEIAKTGVSTVTEADTGQSQPGQSVSRRRGSGGRTRSRNNHSPTGRHREGTPSNSDDSTDAGDANASDASAARNGDGRETTTEQSQLDHAAPEGATASGSDAEEPEENDPSAAKTQASDRSNLETPAERRTRGASLAAVETQPRQSVAPMLESSARKEAATPAKPRLAGHLGGGSNTTARSTRNPERAAGGNVLGNDGTSPLLHHEKAAPMVIRLQAFAAGPTKFEPQSGRDATESATDDKRHERESEISASQVDDSVLQRSAVIRHHQALVRDIFTPP